MKPLTIAVLTVLGVGAVYLVTRKSTTSPEPVSSTIYAPTPTATTRKPPIRKLNAAAARAALEYGGRITYYGPGSQQQQLLAYLTQVQQAQHDLEFGVGRNIF